MPNSPSFDDCRRLLAQHVRALAHKGWTPATAGNFSVRASDSLLAITVSGRDKERLRAQDIMAIDLEGRAVGSDLRPSAETLLHTQLYRRFPRVGAVLHTHSRNQTVASRLFSAAGNVRLQGYELLKAFAGYQTHDDYLDVPVFPNTQNMAALAAQVERHLQEPIACHGYLIDGHGIYTWGADLAEARRHLDALEFLLTCELDLRRTRHEPPARV